VGIIVHPDWKLDIQPRFCLVRPSTLQEFMIVSAHDTL
jgi:hypothetical protein